MESSEDWLRSPDIVHFCYGEYHNDSFRLLSLYFKNWLHKVCKSYNITQFGSTYWMYVLGMRHIYGNVATFEAMIHFFILLYFLFHLVRILSGEVNSHPVFKLQNCWLCCLGPSSRHCFSERSSFSSQGHTGLYGSRHLSMM